MAQRKDWPAREWSNHQKSLASEDFLSPDHTWPVYDIGVSYTSCQLWSS